MNSQQFSHLSDRSGMISKSSIIFCGCCFVLVVLTCVYLLRMEFVKVREFSYFAGDACGGGGWPMCCCCCCCCQTQKSLFTFCANSTEYLFFSLRTKSNKTRISLFRTRTHTHAHTHQLLLLLLLFYICIRRYIGNITRSHEQLHTHVHTHTHTPNTRTQCHSQNEKKKKQKLISNKTTTKKLNFVESNAQ